MSNSNIYPDPVYSHRSTTTAAGAGATVDISAANNPLCAPALTCIVVGTKNYDIQGSDNNVTWFSHLAGLTVSRSVRLAMGRRFWRTYVNSGSGTLESSVGAVPRLDGGMAQMNLIIESTTNASL